MVAAKKTTMREKRTSIGPRWRHLWARPEQMYLSYLTAAMLGCWNQLVTQVAAHGESSNTSRHAEPTSAPQVQARIRSHVRSSEPSRAYRQNQDSLPASWSRHSRPMKISHGKTKRLLS